MHGLAFASPLCTTPHVQGVRLHTFQNRVSRHSPRLHCITPVLAICFRWANGRFGAQQV